MDPDAPPVLVAISDWRLNVKFTDAGGDHNAEFPTAGAAALAPGARGQDQREARHRQPRQVRGHRPSRWRRRRRRAGAARRPTASPRTTSSRTTASDPFNAGTADELVSVGNLLINTTDNTHCSITNVAAHVLTCAPGSDMQWDEGDDYEVVGDNTKDLVVRLGVELLRGGRHGHVRRDHRPDRLAAQRPAERQGRRRRHRLGRDDRRHRPLLLGSRAPRHRHPDQARDPDGPGARHERRGARGERRSDRHRALRRGRPDQRRLSDTSRRTTATGAPASASSALT